MNGIGKAVDVDIKARTKHCRQGTYNALLRFKAQQQIKVINVQSYVF